MNWRQRLWNPAAARARGVEEGRFFKSLQHSHVELMIRAVQVNWPQASREEVMQAALQARRERLAAVPDLSRYPELDGAREALEASDEGLRDGGGYSPEQAAVCREYIWLCRKHSEQGGVLPDRGCTGVFIAQSPEGPLAASNLDDWIDSAPLPLPRAPLTTPLGLGRIDVSCGILLDEPTPEIFPAPVSHLLSELCGTVEEGVELLARYNFFWGPRNRLLWDKSGASAVIEKSACRYGVRWGDGCSYTTAMHMETPEMKKFLHGRHCKYLQESGKGEDSIDGAYWRAAQARHHNLARLTQQAAQNPSFEALRSVMQSRDGAASLCLHGDKSHRDDEHVNYTLSTTVWEVARNKATCWRIRSQDGPPACQSEPEEVCFFE